MTATIIGTAAAALWLYLIGFRGRFWRVRHEPLAVSAAPQCSVVTVVPARDEAAVIGRTVASLLRQRYRGPFHIVVVDDQSSDGTATAARAAGSLCPDRLTVAAGRAVPVGWTGKLWALHQGIEIAER
jgi:cellulose synthase/poly-beta-1,6-N-acetylglucosamine synthase-like glycosyltransferase